MILERFAMARKYLDDARYLLAAGRLDSAASRASYAAYQVMWAALEDPPSGGRWRHLRVITHFMRGYWFAPMHPPTWPGLLEHLRLPLNRLYQFRVDADYDLILLDSVSAEECIATTARTIAEVDQTSASTPAPHEITLPG